MTFESNMIIKNAVRKIKSNHLIIALGTKDQQQQFVQDVIRQTNYATHVPRQPIRTINDYVEFIRDHELYQAWYHSKKKFNSNQLLDFHRDWLIDNNSLLVLEAFHELEDRWKVDLIQGFIEAQQHGNSKNTRAIITLDQLGDWYDMLFDINWFKRKKDKRTNQQIVMGGLEIIYLDDTIHPSFKR